MPAPKSIVKIKKSKASDGIELEYTSNIDAVNYYLFELNRAALRDVAKFVKKKFAEEYYKHFQKITGAGGKAVSAKVFSSRSTTAPRVEIGLKSGAVSGFYAFYQELGTSKQPKLGILQNVVESNVSTIIEIESKYLSGLKDEAKAQSLIDSEEDYDIEEDDDEQ